MRPCVIILLAALGWGGRLDAGSSPLLNRAAAPWLEESERWAFTARVTQFTGAEVKEIRVERYDPSKPAGERWELVTVNGRPPAPERLQAWRKAKARKYLQGPKVFADNFDFENVRIVETKGQTITYALPMHSNHAVVLPLDHIELTVTVNRATHAIEQVKAGVDQPFRTALGLARIIELHVDLKVLPGPSPVAAVTPATARPAGPASAVLAKLGERVEYEWSEFRRVEK